MPPDPTWNQEEQVILSQLNSPWKVQQYLDSLPYTTDHQTRSPRRVMRDRCAHCTEGAIFAAAALRYHGRAPLIIDLRAENDDDHVIAIYRVDELIGAVAKSNFSGLRFREPIHRGYRELALSYFEHYFNVLGEKTLRSYSRPLDLSTVDAQAWMTTEKDLEWVGQRLDSLPHYPLINRETARQLHPVDERLYEAGLLGADPAGLFDAKAAEKQRAT
jgi:succinate dehydrogenase flavin-adding protein (antitoxin of CptAB toxin-antitoxin module)